MGRSFSSHSVPTKGKVFVVGDNVEGQLGVSGASCSRATPIENLPAIISMACGHMHTLLVDVNGHVWSFGSSSFGETGLEVDIDICPPTKIDLDVKIVEVSAGKAHTLLLSDVGEVYSFGDGESNQLGYAAQGSNVKPKRIEALRGVNVRKLVSGALHNIVIDDKGNGYSWGSGHYAQHGQQVVDMIMEPKQLNCFSEEITLASAGLYHSVVVTKSQKVYFFGGTKVRIPGGMIQRTLFFLSPTPVQDLQANPGETWTHLTSGITHNIISSDQGRTFAWGLNTGMSVGSSSAAFDRAVQLQSLDGIQFRCLTAGSYHNIGCSTQGQLWGWGQGSDYQLGNNRRSVESPLPLDLGIPADLTVRKVAAGWAHTLLLTEPKL
jgi:alpha-tubulin suppressor-like RCC1 family protein